MDRLTEHRNHGRELRLQAESSIGFIGAGNMAASLIHGLINRGQTPNTLFAADIDQDKLDSLAQSTGIQATTPQTIAERADVIVLAVKPQVMSAVCSELGALAGDRSRPALFISVAAGTPLASLESWLGALRQWYAVCPIHQRWWVGALRDCSPIPGSAQHSAIWPRLCWRPWA